MDDASNCQGGPTALNDGKVLGKQMMQMVYKVTITQ
jgi:hypothetical protein